MRLLNTRTIKVEEFSNNVPEYAILSHTWGKDEVLYDDAKQGRYHLEQLSLNPLKKVSVRKVLDSCDLALEHNYDYIWIDTCCIDKSSSAELSEAINSMFDWYMGAAVCYAFIDDFEERSKRQQLQQNPADKARYGVFGQCRWFKRGWTLQELLAPPYVSFYDRNWYLLGDRVSLSSQISLQTGIDRRILVRHRDDCTKERMWSLTDSPSWCDSCQTDLTIRPMLRSISISTRMNWAAHRETTRIEDRAYCLMGIFDINMPLLYGEGQKAFQRLQQEMAKTTRDQTILAWQLERRTPAPYQDHAKPYHHYGPNLRSVGLFAPGPDAFQTGLSVHQAQIHADKSPLSISGRGLELDVLLGNRFSYESGEPLHFAVLDCQTDGDPLTFTLLVVKEISSARNTFVRVCTPGGMLFEFSHKTKSETDPGDNKQPAGFPSHLLASKFAVTRRHIRLIEEDDTVNISNIASLRLNYEPAEVCEQYSLCHKLPSLLVLSDHSDSEWGLLCFTGRYSATFFLVWYIHDNHPYCAAHSSEQILGDQSSRLDPSSTSFRTDIRGCINAAIRASRLAKLAREDSTIQRRSSLKCLVQDPRAGNVEITMDKVELLGRSCYQVNLRRSEGPYRMWTKADFTDDLFWGTHSWKIFNFIQQKNEKRQRRLITDYYRPVPESNDAPPIVCQNGTLMVPAAAQPLGEKETNDAVRISWADQPHEGCGWSEQRSPCDAVTNITQEVDKQEEARSSWSLESSPGTTDSASRGVPLYLVSDLDGRRVPHDQDEGRVNRFKRLKRPE